jgi:hypothetical protein
MRMTVRTDMAAESQQCGCGQQIEPRGDVSWSERPVSTAVMWNLEDLNRGRQLGCDRRPILGLGVSGQYETHLPQGQREHDGVVVLVGCVDLIVLGPQDCERNASERDGRIEVHADGTVQVLATAADGLDYPASIAFGLGDDASSLYIANVGAAFGTPSVMRATIGAT